VTIVKINNLHKSYGEKVLFKDISFNINDGDKIGLLGINGTGKSTLLNIIFGKDDPDSGEIQIFGDQRIEMLSQDPDFDLNCTVINQIFQKDALEMNIISEYETVLSKVEKGEDGFRTRLLELSEMMDSKGLWRYESEIKSILTKLDINQFDSRMANLSGGQRKRVALAAALISQCDLLILDEPTNHLDSDMVQWLEEYLNARKGALLMVTHDRYFLDRVTNHMIELERGYLQRYIGNYTSYVEEKTKRLAIEEASRQKNEKLYRKELEWIRKSARARTTKQKARIDRFEGLKEGLSDFAADYLDLKAPTSRLGKTVIELKDINKSFGQRLLLKDFSYIFKKNDRVGIIGPNGSGKTTLMKIINREIIPDSGEVKIGQTVKMGYFSQESETLNEEMRVIDYIKEAGEFFELSEKEKISASRMLDKFLFIGAVQYNYICRLSGGEKRRLYLLRTLMESPNVLMLDEPTNDLDLSTLQILEDFLDDYEGVAVIISHDRYFLDRVCQHIISFEGNGKLAHHTGNYSEYFEKKNRLSDDFDEKNEKSEKQSEKKVSRTRKIKFSFLEQKEFDEIESEIEKLEREIAHTESEAEKNASNYIFLQEMMKKKELLEAELLNKYERWEYLNELARQIEKQ
jgi:ABC transport system ATP-binding/permease protein